MVDIKYDKHSEKYWLTTVNLNTPLTFEQLEAFSEQLQQLCADEYSRALAEDLFDNGVCDGCTI